MTAETHDPTDRYFLGLDLGQCQDFSAVVALRRRLAPAPGGVGPPVPRWKVRGLKRWPLGTLYAAVAAEVAKLTAGPPLAGCVLGVDRTGCGQAVCEMIRAARPRARMITVLITAGHAATREGSDAHVPKQDLVAALRVLLEGDRLEVPDTIPGRDVFLKELLAFRSKVQASGHEVLESWRERDHDDLVLATAIACWLGSRPSQGDPAAGGKQPDYSAAQKYEMRRAGYYDAD